MQIIQIGIILQNMSKSEEYKQLFTAIAKNFREIERLNK
jgi:hypothetical protein